jgi:hypothetical protein
MEDSLHIQQHGNNFPIIVNNYHFSNVIFPLILNSIIAVVIVVVKFIFTRKPNYSCVPSQNAPHLHRATPRTVESDSPSEF